jgi:hypothetical protein
MGQRKVTMNKYTEIMGDWNYDGSNTLNVTFGLGNFCFTGCM